MKKNIDLLEGNIYKTLIKLSLPIMATSFIQMFYTLTNMLWLGRTGSDAVAGAGTAGFYTWLATAFVLISKTGVEVRVAQSIGRKDYKAAKKYIETALQISVILSILYGGFLIIFRNPLIAFFHINDNSVVIMAKQYLIPVAAGMIFTFLNPVFTAMFNASGNSRTPFVINTIGLVINAVLDPVLIFGIGVVPALGVFGAAIASVFAQAVVTGCFLMLIEKSKESYLKFNLVKKVNSKYAMDLFKIGFPVAVQNGLFTIFAMFIGRIIAVWGSVPIAVQKVGSQIEAISWMTAGGFSTALGTFVGQNYGGGNHHRIIKGYKATLLLASVVGIFATLLLVFGGKTLFSFFINEPNAINLGVDYLRILGYSQLFMCLEITTSGVFNGLGRTSIPSIISIILTGARLPAAVILSKASVLGLNGVWWSISISSILKGIVLTLIFALLYKKFLNKEELEGNTIVEANC